MTAQARRTGRPNDYDWELSRGSSLAVAAGVITQFEAFISDTAETLMRLRGDVIITLDGGGSAATDTIVVAWGVIRSAAGSSDVGVSPITEGGANWLAYGIATLTTEVAVGSIAASLATTVRWPVDSKAMRRLRENESLYVIFESADVVGAPSTNLAFALRGLTAR